MPKINFKEKVDHYEKKISNLVLRNASEPIYITFNFSFMTNNSTYNFDCEACSLDHKHHLIERIVSLSNKDIVSLTAKTSKNWGLEKIDFDKLGRTDKLKNIEIPRSFGISKRNDLAGDSFWIFRLCPNNNPFPSRVIGKMIDNVFYVFFIDYHHDLYARRN